MTEREQAVTYSLNGDHDGPARLTAFPDFILPEDQPADVAVGLVSLGYIWAAIQRKMRLVCALALVGIVIGLGFFKIDPPAHRAQTSVLITYGIDENPSEAVFDEQAIAESHTVAKLAMAKLGIHQSLGSFAASYSVTIVTERVLQITASAKTSSEAVSRANAIASSFLQLRAQQQEQAQQVVTQSMQQEVPGDMQSVASLQSKVAAVEHQPKTSAQQAELKKLQAQENQAALSLSVLQEAIAENQAGSQTLAAIKGSVVLDPAEAVSYSTKKWVLIYAVYGLVGGLALGLGIVVIGAVTSDRLRRRDDIARALGAPVKLSVGASAGGRKAAAGQGGIGGADDPDIRRIVAHLREAVSMKDGHRALAVVPVDEPKVAALALAALAVSIAQEGRKVMLADLASGAPAATVLGMSGPGVGMVRAQEAPLMLAVPGPAEIAPSAPVRDGSATAPRSAFSDQIGAAYASVDVLLTLATLDPAYGGDHLATWANSAVAVVTAGRSSWARLQATGEMIRLAGVPLVSAVLVGADKSDASLGLPSGSGALLGAGRLS